MDVTIGAGTGSVTTIASCLSIGNWKTIIDANWGKCVTAGLTGIGRQEATFCKINNEIIVTLESKIKATKEEIDAAEKLLEVK